MSNGYVSVNTWGNSSGVRIPKNILKKSGISIGDELEIEVSDNKIILKKTFRHKSFRERLSDYDGKISNVDFDWGEPAGQELF